MWHCIGVYPYPEDLPKLDQIGARAPVARSSLQAVITPSVLPHWELLLADHPEKGIKEGFWIGFNRRVKLASARKNML